MIPLPSFLRRPERVSPPDLLAQIREEIANGLHTGHVRPGDRLPSIRQTARERGVDHRAVARAYRVLEEEGLVEVRGRSGVFAATPLAAAEGRPVGKVVDWMAAALADAWMRGIAPGDIARLARVSTEAPRIRCACVESNEDQMEAYAAEIQAGTGMTVVQVYVGPGELEGNGAVGKEEGVRRQLACADVVVTTQFQAPAVRALLGESGPPLVVLKINPDLVEAVREHLRRAPLTIVAVSAEFGARMRLMYRDDLHCPDRIRLILASDLQGLRALDPREPILLTRAARRRLPDLAQPRLVFPHSPTLAPPTVRALAQLAVQLCG